jgi:hypothetical protein
VTLECDPKGAPGVYIEGPANGGIGAIISSCIVSDESTELEWLCEYLGATLTIGGIDPVITCSLIGMLSGLILPKRWLSNGLWLAATNPKSTHEVILRESIIASRIFEILTD